MKREESSESRASPGAGQTVGSNSAWLPRKQQLSVTPVSPHPELDMQSCLPEVRGAGGAGERRLPKGRVAEPRHTSSRHLPNFSKMLSSDQRAHLNKWHS